jgi:hypothetical protein
MPAAAPSGVNGEKGQVVAVVMIGVDPHKGSHTAVALGADEAPLGQELVAAGELVLDVQPKLAARVRLLAAGTTTTRPC